MTARLPIKRIVQISLLLSSLFVFSTSSFATNHTTTSETLGIEVSAPTYVFNIEPGGFAQEIIRVKNVSNTNQTFYPEVFDFKALDEKGTPGFISTQESENYTHSLASWITISKEPIAAAINESVALSFTVNVPANAEPGGKFAGVLFGTQPSQPGAGQVAISNKVGSLILVRVAGEANEIATIKEFSTDKTSYDKGPVNFVVRVENNGNVHVVPKGTIEIKNLFGSKLSVADVNEPGGNVLPDSVRRFDEGNGLSWQPEGFAFGRYTATLLLTYGDPAKTLTSEVSFWIIPWTQLAIVGGALIIALVLLVLAIRQYNRMIVARALKNSQGGNNNPQ